MARKTFTLERYKLPQYSGEAGQLAVQNDPQLKAAIEIITRSVGHVCSQGSGLPGVTAASEAPGEQLCTLCFLQCVLLCSNALTQCSYMQPKLHLRHACAVLAPRQL